MDFIIQRSLEEIIKFYNFYEKMRRICSPLGTNWLVLRMISLILKSYEYQQIIIDVVAIDKTNWLDRSHKLSNNEMDWFDTNNEKIYKNEIKLYYFQKA